MAFDYISHTVDSALLANPFFSETVTYRRDSGGSADAVAAFPVSALVYTSGEYQDPKGPFYAAVFLQTACIPDGPQKNDFITISDGAVKAGDYLVQEIFGDPRAGSALLKVRWAGPAQ